ncbi:MAG: S-layer homology domain-containing protein [Brasilonema angustatum HA4187-MV1]|jgi:parallel beta-helix repeat protein|nr:S-layer homology domain-containing protein [Brasilonema angustatum HA4187-MV1]
MVNSTVVATLTIYVNPTIGNDANAGTRLNPYKTITRALKVTTTPKVIQLACGSYSAASGEIFPLVIPVGVMLIGHEATKGQGIVILGSGKYESESFGIQNITLVLLNYAQLMGITVVNPTKKGTGVWIESTSPTLANNTFTKCGREAVFVSGSAEPLIQDNVFLQNGVSGLVMAGDSKGEVLNNLFQKNLLGIAISDNAVNNVLNNTFYDNRNAIALSRNARPILRNNLIENNIQTGLLVNGNAAPDLGSTQNPGGNIFRNNGQFDIQNATSAHLLSVGNNLNSTKSKGMIEFINPTEDIVPVSVNTDFSDMTGHWAIAFVEVLHKNNLMNGFPDGTFRPKAPITRAEYADVIARSFQLPPGKKIRKFTDVKRGFWASSAIERAASMEFISAFPDGTFRPMQNLTRIQTIVSLVNGLKLSGGNPNILGLFGDSAQIPSAATNAVAVATENLLIVNYPDIKLLEPLRDITRAEVAACIYQALVTSGKQKPISSPYIVNPNVEIASDTEVMTHWAAGFIQALLRMGLTHGFAYETFEPDKPITRAQYAALVAVCFNPTAKHPATEFTDVPKDFWAYNAIKIAAQAGFVGGFRDRTFRPEQNVLRLQVIVSLVNGLGLKAADNNSLLGLSDHNIIPSYARSAVATATQNKIVVNYPDSKQFHPNREATRGEVAAMVYQALVAVRQTPSINSPYIFSHS